MTVPAQAKPQGYTRARSGSLADIAASLSDVRFTPESEHRETLLAIDLWFPES